MSRQGPDDALHTAPPTPTCHCDFPRHLAGLPLLEQAAARDNWGIYQAVAEIMQPPPANAPSNATSADVPAADGAGPGALVAANGGAETEQALVCSACLAHDVNEGFGRFEGSRLYKVRPLPTPLPTPHPISIRSPPDHRLPPEAWSRVASSR